MSLTRLLLLIIITTVFAFSSLLSSSSTHYEEQDGFIVVEAEDFASQHLDQKRRWLVFSANTPQHHYADNDGNHAEYASGGQYIELLPDTRTNHGETLVHGENFSNKPGKVAVLSYPIHVNTPGTYYVWARAFSTGSEDNGLHIGLNGRWPESGQRLQLCEGKYQWTWSSAQRVPSNHCGVPRTITIDIPHAGAHTLMISMREDGFELDKLLLTQDRGYQPEGSDKKATQTKQVELPEKSELRGITRYSKILYADKDFDSKIYSIEKKDIGLKDLTLVTLSEVGEKHRYRVFLNDEAIGDFQNPSATENNKEAYFTIKGISLNIGDQLKVHSESGKWRALVIQ